MNHLPVTIADIRALPGGDTFQAAHNTLMARKKKHAAEMRKLTGLTLSELDTLATIGMHLPRYINGEWDILNKDSRRDSMGIAMENVLFKLVSKGLLTYGEQRYSVADLMTWKGRPKTRHHYWYLTDTGWSWFAEYGRWLGQPWDYQS